MKYWVDSIFTKKKCSNTENVRSVTMKKLLAMLLALVMVLSFAACGTTEEPVEEPDAPVEEPTDEPEVEPTYAEEFAAEIEELKAKYAALGLEVTDAFAEDVQKAIDDFIATYGGTENEIVRAHV